MPADFETRVHRTTDGAEIVYRVRPGSNPWVLLHGLGCDASMWDEVVAALPEETGLLVPEFRGHGGSTLGWRQPEVDQWARDVAEIVERQQLDRPAIAGLSMGGYTTLAVAAQFPELARAYALVSTQARPDDDEAHRKRADGLAMLRRGGWRPYAASLMSVLLLETHPEFPRHRERLMEMFGRAGEAGLAATLIALANRPDRRPLLPALRVPSVAIVGDRDLLTPPDRAREIAEGVSDGKLVVLADVAHMSAMEAPSEVARALREL